MIKLPIFVAAIIVCYSGYSQDSLDTGQARHSLHFCGSGDFIFQYYDIQSNESNKYRLAGFHSVLNNYPNYTLCLNYEYQIKQWLSVSCGVSLSNQHYYVSRCSYEPVYINDTLRNLYVYDYRIRYFSFPVGLKVRFFNRFPLRPFFLFEVRNSISFNERIREMTPIQDVYNSYYSHQRHYYDLKGQVTIGLEWFIKKQFILGFDYLYRSKPAFKVDYGMIAKCWYTNMSFGGHIGYVFK